MLETRSALFFKWCLLCVMCRMSVLGIVVVFGRRALNWASASSIPTILCASFYTTHINFFNLPYALQSYTYAICCG